MLRLSAADAKENLHHRPRFITVGRRMRRLLTDTLLFRSGGGESRDTRKNRYSAPRSRLSTKSDTNPPELIIFFNFMPKNHALRSFSILATEIVLTTRNDVHTSAHRHRCPCRLPS